MLEPLVISWGWQAEEAYKSGSDYIDQHQWYGTYDPSASLSVPASIKFQQENNWASVRLSCHELVEYSIKSASQITGQPPIYSFGNNSTQQMAVIPLPSRVDPLRLQSWLYKEEHIEIPCYLWDGVPFVRISIQGYNTREDVDIFLKALKRALSLPELCN